MNIQAKIAAIFPYTLMIVGGICPQSSLASETLEEVRDTGFGASSANMEALVRTPELDERFRLGGSLDVEAQSYFLDATASRRSYLFNPNSLRLYFESRLKNDIRGFGKFRATYDPVAGTGGVSSPLSGTVYPRIQADLEELKLQFNAASRVFFTVGKQKIRWGSGRFWNPSDFLNSVDRDPLSTEDLRSGVSLIKTHVPLASSNAYLVQRVDGADRISRIQNALRFEAPLWEASEGGVTAVWTSGLKPAFSLDLSSDVIGNFDANVEAVASCGTAGPFADRWKPTLLAGFSYDFPYAERDVFTIAAEYFRNPFGLTSKEDYLATILAGAYRPNRLARDYAMVYLFMPGPGSWDDWSFILFQLVN
ncbi:MAG: hypothetical protein AAB425_09665, partial [Bdellovibrionota bacterium]